MKVTVCFDSVRVVVPCGDGSLLVKDLMREAIIRYRKATGKLSTPDSGPVITSLSSLTGGGLLDPDDRLCDVADDREQIIAHLATGDNHGDGASSVGTNSPDFFGDKEVRYRDHRTLGNIKRESVKRLSMHALSNREHMAYNALSLPRELRRREPLGQDAPSFERPERTEVQEIVIKNEPGLLGVDMMPCYDLQGNDQGLKVQKIYPNGRIAKDGRIEVDDKIIGINGQNLLRVHFQKVQEILRSCTNDPCLKISVVKAKKSEPEELQKKISSYNVLQSANTRKIGRMIEIELTKGSDGLGFSVTTRDNPAGGHMPIYIKNILTKGAAVSDGQLKSGDRLLKVNDIEMTGKSQDEVVNFLRNIPPGGKVRMVVSRQEESNLNDSGQREQAIQPVQESRWKTASSPSKERDDKVEILRSPKKKVKHINLDIPVFDSEKAGLGVSVKGKTSNDPNLNHDLGIFIKSVLHGGAASRDGRLMTNDQLLEINGESLLGLSNSAAMDTLRRAMINSKSATTGIISLKIARQVSGNFDGEKYQEELISGMGGCKVETANSIYIDDKEGRDNGLDNGNLSPVWNPVIDRLTDQYNKNSRNESYCLATNKTWRESMSQKLFTRAENILLEDSNDKRSSDKDSQYTDDPTYDSQLSLEFPEFSGKFARDAVGRQSMSEKGHATLDAKNTDTYKRNKKLKENKDEEDKPPSAEVAAAAVSREINPGSGVVTESTSFEATRRRFEKKATESPEFQANKPRKHWLVDDDRNPFYSQGREEGGFDNSRGDVKQASLNALDKRSKKKGKVSAILRLVKNRKSLNLGDNIESRDNNNYMSGTINYIQ